MSKKLSTTKTRGEAQKRLGPSAGDVDIARDVFPLPATSLVAASLPARIASVAVKSIRYEEQPNVSFATRNPAAPGPLDVSLRAEYGWAGDRIIVLTVHATIKTPEAPVHVDATVSLRVAFEAIEATTGQQLWQFVKEAGLRIAFPFVRTHIATITAMGSLGSIAIEPLLLSLGEPAPQSEG